MSAPPAAGVGRIRRMLAEADLIVVATAFVQYGFRFFSNIILSYLLFPEAFGLVAIISTVLTGLSMLFDTALFVSLISRKGVIPRDDLDLLWTMQVIRVVVICALGSALAPFVAAAYGEPALTMMLVVGAFSTFLSGFASLYPHLELREGRLWPMMRVEIVRQVVGVFASILLALLLRDTWALVWSMVIGSCVHIVISYHGSGGYHRLRMTRGFFFEQLRFMRWFQVAGICYFLGGQIDKLLFPLFFGVTLFGVYSVAQSLAIIPAALGQRWVAQVLLPALQRIVHDGDSVLHHDAVRARQLGVSYIGIMCAVVVGGSGPFFVWLYPDSFVQAAIFCPLLAAVIFFNQSEYALRQTFIVNRRQKYDALGEVARLTAFLTLLAIFIPREGGDPLDYIRIFFATQVVIWGGYVLLARSFGYTRLRAELLPLAGFGGLSAGLFEAGAITMRATGPLPALALVGAGGLGALAVLLWRYGLPRPHRPPVAT